MPKLADILKNKKDYPDESSIDFLGEKVTLADLRALNAATEGELAKRQDELNKQADLVERARQEVVDLWKNTQAAQIVPPAAAPAAAPVAAAPASGQYNYEVDPILGPLWKTNQQLADDIKKRDEQLKQVVNGLQQMAMAYVQYETQRTFNSIPDRLENGPDYKKTYEYAIQNRLLDQNGMPLVDKAYGELTRAEREAAREAKIREDERLKAKQELAASAVRPTGSQFASVPAKGKEGKTQFRSIQEALDNAIAQAKADPEIQAQLAGVNVSNI